MRSNLSEVLEKYPELKKLGDPLWRISHLYKIKDKEGNQVTFKPNWAQKKLLKDPHKRKIVLKARQLGITTFFCIYYLDKVLWERDIQAGIIAHTLDDAKNIFTDKLKYAFDRLHPALRELFHTVGDSARELSFKHGSVIRVGTSLRSSTLQYLHISEYGKICAKYPEKAREVMTGALNTLSKGSVCVIESTAEGREGSFYDMTQKAFETKNSGKEFSDLDFYPFFFPWWKHPDYSLDFEKDITKEDKEYFDKLSLSGIDLSDEQKWWYVSQKETQGEDMLREYPSTQEEAFMASQEGTWYTSQIKELLESGRVTSVSHDKACLVNTAWDLGQADALVIWFFQVTPSGEIRVIDYFERSDCALDEVVQVLQSKGYTYGTHIWPHDARARDRAGITFEQQASEYGLSGIVLERHGLQDGIQKARLMMSRMYFDEEKCREGLNALQKYKKKWNTSIGGFTSEPLHDQYSHGADAFRYLCAGLDRVTQESGESDEAALKAFFS
jgi:hypothetical protein